jgi:hypothetical protein
MQTIYAYLPLASPLVSQAADTLAQSGFFLAGIFPFYFSGGDALIMQKCAAGDSAPLRIYSHKAKEMLKFILAERESMLCTA